MENKFCPLTKQNCEGEKCAWYVGGLNDCSVNVIAQATDELTNIVFDEVRESETDNAN